jgi:hypothetical protein
MLTLTEFLLARIAEDESRARAAGADAMVGARWKHYPEDAYNEVQAISLSYSKRLLAECEAKRRIVEQEADLSHWNQTNTAILAAVYADHPDYREEWKP